MRVVPDGDDSGALDERRLRELIDVGRGLVAELDLEVVLSRVLEVACELTGARYAAVGVLDGDRRELERFITRGIGERARDAIGSLPRGRGVLGLLIEDPAPLRLRNVGDHPRSYGFPPGHPPMTSFLGVPIVVRGEAWGNLYLTEKTGGDFDEADEQSARSSPSGRRSRSATPIYTATSRSSATTSSAPSAASRRQPRSSAPSAARPTSTGSWRRSSSEDGRWWRRARC